MANCYFCGCSVRNGEGYRRKVLTSESARVYFTKRGGGSYGQTYALRTLCVSCAQQLDERNKSRGWQLPISVVAGVVGTIMAIRWAVTDRSDTSGIGSFIYAFFLFGGLGFITYFFLKFISSGGSASSYTDDTSVNEFPEAFQSKAVECKEKNELSDHKESIMQMAMFLGDMGVSLQGIYGLPHTPEGWNSVNAKILLDIPPKDYASKSEWEAHLKKKIFSSFSLIVLSDNSNSKQIAFPKLENETNESYETRTRVVAAALMKTAINF